MPLKQVDLGLREAREAKMPHLKITKMPHLKISKEPWFRIRTLWLYQQQPVVPQQNQEGLHAGLTVTRPEAQAALLTTSLQQPQQQLPHQQQ